MKWDDAKKVCEALGEGWRLPTKDELLVLYNNKDKIGRLTNIGYWSSTEEVNNGAWLQMFVDGKQDPTYKYTLVYVRAVRSL